jgi:hypothetical protein
MNKTEKFFLLQKLDALLTYSELLPEDFKDNYLNDVMSVKKFITEYKISDDNKPKPIVEEKKHETDNVFKGFSFTPASEDNEEEKIPQKPSMQPSPLANKNPSAPPPPMKPGGFINFKSVSQTPPPPINEEKDDEVKITPPSSLLKPIADKKSTFHFATNLLVPRLTSDGKKMMGDLSLPINQYLALKQIDDKSSLFKQFEKHYNSHKTNFTEFISSMYDLEVARYITFVKSDTTTKDAGLVKIEEFLVEGKIVTEEDMGKATAHQKAQGGMFATKSLIALKVLTEDKMSECFKVQKWLARTLEKAVVDENLKQVATPIPSEITNKPQKPLENVQKNIPGLPSRPLASGHVSSVNVPPPPPVHKEEVEILAGPLNFIIPVFNEKGQTILNDPSYKELASRISIIDGNTTLLNNFIRTKETFKTKLSFMKFVLKLDGQGIFSYKENDESEEKEVWIKIGELMKSLSLINEDQLQSGLTLKEEKGILLGQAFIELGYTDNQTIEDVLKIQEWLNRVLSNISYETSFVEVIKGVLLDSFKCEVDIGSFRKVAFQDPIKDIVYIKYPITGKLHGNVYYISDRFFMQSLANTIMNSVGGQASLDLDNFDESYVGVVSSVIISNSLAKLSQLGLFDSAQMAKILMEKEVSMAKETVVANQKTISLIPLNNQFGRFAIGLDVTSED